MNLLQFLKGALRVTFATLLVHLGMYKSAKIHTLIKRVIRQGEMMSDVSAFILEERKMYSLLYGFNLVE